MYFLSRGCEPFGSLLSIRLTYLMAPDERSSETSQRVEGEAAKRKDQEDEDLEY
jgi:hypothetical protein